MGTVAVIVLVLVVYAPVWAAEGEVKTLARILV